jgi:hypothetical protein
MLYMVIERFKPGAATEIYRRLRKEGRHLVDGLESRGRGVARACSLRRSQLNLEVR